MTTWSRSIFPGQSQGNPKHHDQEENSDRGDTDPHRHAETLLLLSDRAGIVKAARRILLRSVLMSGFAFESRLRGSVMGLVPRYRAAHTDYRTVWPDAGHVGTLNPGWASACGAIG